MISIMQNDEGTTTISVDFPVNTSPDMVVDAFLSAMLATFGAFVELSLQSNDKPVVLDVVGEMNKVLMDQTIEKIKQYEK